MSPKIQRFACPISADTDVSGGYTCHVCDKVQPDLEKLIKHFKNVHSYTASFMKGSWVHSQSLLARKKRHVMTDAERLAVGLADDERCFICKLCGDKPISKLHAMRHFSKAHGNGEVDLHTLNAWVVVKDGNCIRHHKPEQMQLSLVLGGSGVPDDEHGQGDGDAGDDVVAAAALPACAVGADGGGLQAQQEGGEPCAPTDHTRDQGVGALTMGEGNAMVLINMPGGSHSAMILVPRPVAFELVASGFLEEFEGGRLLWNSIVPVDMQQAQLLELMPEGPQKRAMEKKFVASGGIAAHPPLPPPTAHMAATQRGTPVAQPVQAPVPAAGVPDATGLAQLLAELKAFMEGHASSTPRVKLQALAIDVGYASWVVPEAWKGKHRNNFPFKETSHQDEDYDKFMEVRRLKPETRKMYMRGMARFVMVVRPSDDTALDCPNILVNVFRSGLFQKLQELPILSDSYSCTRQTVVALGHFAVMTKLRYQAAGDVHGAQIIDQVINGVLSPWGKRCSASQKESAQAKYVEDAKLIASFHTPQRLKQVAHNQYLELVAIHRAVCVDKTHELTDAILFKATSCVIAGWYTNAQPGRSMELQTLPRKTVDEFLAAEDVEYFSYSNYKTFRIYGAGGKWVCPANRQAFSLYREIVDTAPHLHAGADPENSYFFQRQTISVHTCLRSASVTEKLDPPLKVNLTRKVYAVWAKLNKTTAHDGEDAEDLFAKVARSDKHKFGTAAAIYGAITPEEDARLSKHCFYRLMGEPVPFPSTSDWETHGRSLDDVMSRCRGEDVGQGAEEGEEEELDIESLVGNYDDEAVDEWADVLGAGEDGAGHQPGSDFAFAEHELVELLDGAHGCGIDADAAETGDAEEDTWEGCAEAAAEEEEAETDELDWSFLAADFLQQPGARVQIKESGAWGALVSLDEVRGEWVVDVEGGGRHQAKWSDVVSEALLSGEVDEGASEPAAKKIRRSTPIDAKGDRVEPPVAQGGAAAARGRKSAFSDAQKRWIVAKHASVYSSKSIATKTFMRDIAADGAKECSLPSTATADQVREVVRAHFRP
jgi:hypothetical protein